MPYLFVENGRDGLAVFFFKSRLRFISSLGAGEGADFRCSFGEKIVNKISNFLFKINLYKCFKRGGGERGFV